MSSKSILLSFHPRRKRKTLLLDEKDGMVETTAFEEPSLEEIERFNIEKLKLFPPLKGKSRKDNDTVEIDAKVDEHELEMGKGKRKE